MYELTLGIDLAPRLAAEAAAAGTTLSAFGAIWLGMTAILFLAMILAVRRSDADVPSHAESWDAELRDAA